MQSELGCVYVSLELAAGLWLSPLPNANSACLASNSRRFLRGRGTGARLSHVSVAAAALNER